MIKMSLLMIFPVFALLSFLSPLYAGTTALEKECIKSQILSCQEEIKQAKSEQLGSLKVQLSILHCEDQNLVQAFTEFLDALAITEKWLSPSQITSFAKGEKEVYDKALQLYLSHASGQAHETSQKMINEYESIANENPHFYHLNYLICAALANKGQFDQFFERFYISYKKDPFCHMAYRTKAILHIKLLEKARTDGEKEDQRAAIFANLLKANQLHNEDTSTYKMMIAFSKEEEKSQTVRNSLKKILEGSMLIPRGDILFYVQAAIDTKQQNLAKEFIEKAREWYPNSRVIDHAEGLLARE